MTEQQNPITPPDELVRKWLENYFGCWDNVTTAAADVSRYIAAKSTQWGYEQRGADIEAKLQKARDEELEACVEWVEREIGLGRECGAILRAARRPKPQSLKEEALEALKHAEEGWRPVPADCEIIRRALEQLDD